MVARWDNRAHLPVRRCVGPESVGDAEAEAGEVGVPKFEPASLGGFVLITVSVSFFRMGRLLAGVTGGNGEGLLDPVMVRF
jgi:hypothetical protein